MKIEKKKYEFFVFFLFFTGIPLDRVRRGAIGRQENIRDRTRFGNG